MKRAEIQNPEQSNLEDFSTVWVEKYDKEASGCISITQVTVLYLALTVLHVTMTVLYAAVTVLYVAVTVLYLAVTVVYVALTVLYVPDSRSVTRRPPAVFPSPRCLHK